MAPATWRLLLFLAATAATNVDDGPFAAVKCCPRGQELSTNLTECQRLTNISDSGDGRNFTVDLSETEADGDSLEYNVTSAEDAALGALAWLPEHLRRELKRGARVTFGRRSNCSDGPGLRLVTPRDEDRFEWLPNGSLALRSPTPRGGSERRLFAAGDFCADSFTDGAGARRRALLLCPCARVRCVKKCCPWGEALACNASGCHCAPHGAAWSPLHPALPPPNDAASFEVVIDDNVTCGQGYKAAIDAFAGYPFYMIETFWAKLWQDANVCGETMIIWHAAPRQGLVRCMRRFPFPKLSGAAHWLHVPEAALLGLALAVLLAVPRRRLSVYAHAHDLAMWWHGAALLARSALWPLFASRGWMSMCDHVPLAIYFFSVAAAFWLNVICMNIVFGFMKPRGPQRSSYAAALRMFVAYSAYAWGASAALTALTAAAWHARAVPPWLLRPTLHETRTCFREQEGEGKAATFAYFYGPTGGLLLANALLFACAALRVRQLTQHSAVLAKGPSAANRSFRNERSVMIYVKILWLMGVVETAVEIVSWAINSNEFYNAFIGSCIDLTRACAIFALCCCKRRTLQVLRERVRACAPARWWRCGQPARETSASQVSGGREGSATDSVTEATLCSSVDDVPGAK